ncbi:alpha-L-fucosidase [Rhizobium leguminosarum]|uniref:alpha-L-fucosidase n=1 Tax=Rhizobium leguminosarum TaxID=384 RepID=A0A444HTG7_RHILE|nr:MULTISPECIES: alpha-L-fucosidase [Rhizobium]NKL61459.1 alpha-L-fucosidase [Rhizobium leguminosarum bv. viciae]RWX15879.1 alpha-L-fucosidase [Rhizobium leguminosarum]RWX26671.1 alpha-L-fucosidase [Rhizobium leguminosarum]TAU45698.1 alpha-L-fucosidase [Rhizobium leguminosarum]TBC89693.1 alpha-L-fucosidase [Rhizobium leguminosarum]
MTSSERQPENPALGGAGKHAWFSQDRLGMFIHWGLYALGARHEWLKNREELTDDHYQRYFDNFDPDLYDPKEWARRARLAGMKYVVVTTKHHEGFCLWDSKVTDYKAPNTPCGKDLLTLLVDAFRAEGLRIGFYYSLLDWHHPDFPIDVHHPLRNHPDAKALNAGRNIANYAAYMREQVRELLTGFGRIDIIWFDFSYPGREYRGLPGKGRADWESERLVDLVRELQPEIIVNNRLDLPPGNLPDVTTPEQYTPRVAPAIASQGVLWEACHTFSGSWGYHRDEDTWKSPEQIIQLLIDSVALGGNLLMNVGPTGRGTLDARAIGALEVYQSWMEVNGRSIYGAGPSGHPVPAGCRYTQRGNRLYLHVYNWPYRHIHIEGLADRIAYAQFLHDASEVHWLSHAKDVDSNIGVTVPEGMITLELPVRRPDVTVPVIEIVLKA